MSRRWVLFFLMALNVLGTFAQLSPIEVAIFRGWGSEYFSDKVIPGKGGSGYPSVQRWGGDIEASPVGSSALELQIRAGQKCWIGVGSGFRNLTRTAHYWNGSPHSPGEDFSISENATTFSGTIRYAWSNSSTTVYSALQFGTANYRISSERPDLVAEMSEWHPTFQLIPVALRIGGHFGVHLETGFGMKGIFSFGLSWCTSPRTTSVQFAP